MEGNICYWVLINTFLFSNLPLDIVIAHFYIFLSLISYAPVLFFFSLFLLGDLTLGLKEELESKSTAVSIGDHMVVFIINEALCFSCFKVMSFLST